MEFLDNTSAEAMLFFTLYGITGAVPAMVAIYLLLRKVNVFAPGVTPPKKLRYWASLFLGFSALSHVWWMAFYLISRDQTSWVYLTIVLVDYVLLLTTIAGTMLSMLQDRKRSMWPALATLVPFLVLGVLYTIHSNELILLIDIVYLLANWLIFTTYIILAIRRYGFWLNENYADLENKKVWLSQTVAFLCMLLLVLYLFADNMVLICCLHLIDLVLVGLLVWRVETLQDLSILNATKEENEENSYQQMEILLKEHCEDTRLFLQHDLTLHQLAQKIGTNRSYLSQYFSSKGITYNNYINSLRIAHFINSYKRSGKSRQSTAAQEMIQESGFRSYSTFSRAFIQLKGQSLTAWMRDNGN